MIRKYFVRCLIISITLLVSLSAWSVLPLGYASSPTGVIIPLYSSPTHGYWEVVIQAKMSHPSVPIIAIINPNSGSGSHQDANFLAGIQKLQSSGIVVLGYVSTKYGAASISSVEANIDNYKKWYHVDGVKFDEMSNISGFETYYSILSTYAKVHDGMTMTVGNPGVDTLSTYIGSVNTLTIYEGLGLPSILNLDGWHTGYPKSNFSMEAYGVNSLDPTYVHTASDYVGYMYMTDDGLPNPYDTIPVYFGSLVSMLDTSKNGTVVENSKNGTVVENSKNGTVVENSKNGTVVENSKNGTIPEFGSLVGVVTIISTIGVISISKRFLGQ